MVELAFRFLGGGMMRHLLLFVIAVLGLGAPAHADEIATAGRGVTRVIVVIQMPDGESGVSMGTGFAVTSRHVVTNYHVVRNYDRFASMANDAILGIVPSQGSRPYMARISWTDPARDLAVLEIEGASLAPLRLFTGEPPPSAPVTAMGYPANVDSVTVSSIREFITPMLYVRSSGDLGGTRSVDGLQMYVHTANIGRGNSGGPLVDRCGRVVGVNSAAAHVEQGDGAFAFAISNNELISVLHAANVTFQGEGAPCVTADERAQQERSRIDATAAQARTACDERNRSARERHDELARAEDSEIRRTSERRLFVSIGLMVFSALAMGGAALLASQSKQGPAGVAGAAGGALLLGAIALFVLREPESGPREAAAGENCQALANGIVANMAAAENGVGAAGTN